MATKEFTIPEIQEYIEVPDAPVADATAHLSPFVAKPMHQEPLGFPEEVVDDWKGQTIDAMGDLLGKYRGLRVFMDICVKCGSCTDKCHYYIGTADPKNMPVARQDLLRRVYRRYFTFAGKFWGALGMPGFVGAADLERDMLDEMYSYYHQCSECRRCSVFCPYGIDTAEITMAAREILARVGIGQKYNNEIIGKVYTIGNNLGLPERALEDTLEGLEEDIEDETGVEVKLPLNVKGADILLITPSADFFAEPHVDGLMGYAKVFHEAGVSWTLSSSASEAANFGMFIGSYENMRKISLRIREAALELGVKRIIFGECGHAWRVAYSFLNTLAGPFDFLDQNYPIPQHILDFTLGEIEKGTLNIDKSLNDDMVLTFHDSCNVARASRITDKPGSQFTVPRAVIKAVCNNYVDMDPDTIYEKTFCCGGGGGLLTDDLLELRIKGGLPRMTALQTVTQEYGVTHMAAICAICKSQFTKILPYYGFDMDQIVSVHQLVSSALILTGQVDEDDENNSGEEAA
ncbi:MAG: (Fe-S)-binding protein [Pseudomonadota bacterium]|nr:(Fe-S)-binding protein [Pseudomonadota bacterium]